jgi:predicted acyltransferase
MATLAKTHRWLSLDVFRGMTIALMILVNSPGNEQPYRLLEHSPWNGCTLADLVFPFFVFIIGVSLVFSLSNSLVNGNSPKQIANKVLRRALIIFACGLLLNAIPDHLNFSTLRVFGVLQRIAICYLIAALLFLNTNPLTQLLIVISLLGGYCLLLTRIPVPGYGIDDLSVAANLPAYVDRKLFSSAHLYGKIYDPEGMLSTLPAIATTLLGNLTGIWLKNHFSMQIKLYGLLITGPLAIVLGCLWGFWFPINKPLWTSSYVLVTAGIALILLAATIWLLEVKQQRRWARPFEIFGLNAIAAYILHIVFLRIQNKIILPRMDGTPGNLRFYIAEHWYGWFSIQNASLLYSISYLLLLLVFFTLLYRRKIFLKI